MRKMHSQRRRQKGQGRRWWNKQTTITGKYYKLWNISSIKKLNETSHINSADAAMHKYKSMAGSSLRFFVVCCDLSKTTTNLNESDWDWKEQKTMITKQVSECER